MSDTDDISDIRDYYNAVSEVEDSRLERHQLERDLTWRYFAEYLPPQGRVLEVGAGTGVHTTWLVQHGYQVTAVDLAEAGLKLCQQRLDAAGLGERVSFYTADTRDLSDVPGSDFDAVLVMGPLYHLVYEADRKQAVRQAAKRLKPGGIFFSAFISRYGIMGDLIRNVPDWIERTGEVRSVMERGRDSEHYERGLFRGYFVTVPELAPLHAQAGLQTILIAAVEPAISADDESYNCLKGEQKKLWLDLLYEISQQPGLLESSRHLLYISEKAV